MNLVEVVGQILSGVEAVILKTTMDMKIIKFITIFEIFYYILYHYHLKINLTKWSGASKVSRQKTSFFVWAIMLVATAFILVWYQRFVPSFISCMHHGTHFRVTIGFTSTGHWTPIRTRARTSWLHNLDFNSWIRDFFFLLQSFYKLNASTFSF